MTTLQALDRYFDRMSARGEAEASGYSREKVSFAITLTTDGEPLEVIDLRQTSGAKRVGARIEVPSPVKRTLGVAPNLLWDKSAYLLGRTAGDGRRTEAEHAAFRAAHLELLAGSGDSGLEAMRRFLVSWTPANFDQPPFHDAMLDTNLVFRLAGDNTFIHDRVAAHRLIAAFRSGQGSTAACLVTGQTAPITRLHPSIKGVEGAQSSGAALVSFNLDAFASHGRLQGDNAPTSEGSAFRYGAALNRMLDRKGSNCLPRPIGDATVVFWADANGAGEAAAKAAEAWFNTAFNPTHPALKSDPRSPEPSDAAPSRPELEPLPGGKSLKDVDFMLAEGVRFHVLGLSPNAARLSVRYWLDEPFDVVANRLAEHYGDLTIEPSPWTGPLPPIARMLAKTTAVQEKYENIPAQLAGEVTRAILGGTRYPRTLLSTALMRLRAGDDPSTGWHAAVIRAVLAREHRLNLDPEEIPVSLERDNPSPAYQLGRMFAALEMARRLAVKGGGAPVRHRAFGLAAATPATAFPMLFRRLRTDLDKLRSASKGGWLEREVEEIANQLPAALPRSMKLEAQGIFAIGYYHQRSAYFAGRPAAEVEGADDKDEL